MKKDPKMPELLVEQLHLRELATEDEACLRKAHDAHEIERKLTSLREDDARFAQEHPQEEMLASIQRKLHLERVRLDHARRTRRQRMTYGMSALAVAGALLVVVVRPGGRGGVSPDLDPSADITRLKGPPFHLTVYRRLADQAQQLEDGALASAGDVLQLGYVAGPQRYGVIASVDGAGNVTLHLPEREGAAAKLEPRKEHLLTHAYELDDAPDFERFFFVTSDSPFRTRDVTAPLRVLATDAKAARHEALPVDAQLSQRAFLVIKE